MPDGRMATAEYPFVLPTKLEIRRLEHVHLLCPGCSAQDVALGRCHATILADKFGAKSAIGMQCLNKDRLRDVMHSADVCFVGRRPPRGMSKVWPTGFCGRSALSNPFVVRKGGFALGESLALFGAYVDNEFVPLTDDIVTAVVAAAPSLPTDSQILETTLAYSASS